jgi:hypothetical protein
VRGLADKGDALCKEIFRVQANALGLFFAEMVNTFDPDALIVGGGALETSPEFQRWFIEEVCADMPSQRDEQAELTYVAKQVFYARPDCIPSDLPCRSGHAWPGISSQLQRFGGTEYRVRRREIGHVHRDRVVDNTLSGGSSR